MPALLKGIPRQDSESDEDTASSKRDEGSDCDGEEQDGGDSPAAMNHQSAFSPIELGVGEGLEEVFQVVTREPSATTAVNDRVEGAADCGACTLADMVLELARTVEDVKESGTKKTNEVAKLGDTPLSGLVSVSDRHVTEQSLPKTLNFTVEAEEEETGADGTAAPQLQVEGGSPKPTLEEEVLEEVQTDSAPSSPIKKVPQRRKTRRNSTPLDEQPRTEDKEDGTARRTRGKKKDVEPVSGPMDSDEEPQRGKRKKMKLVDEVDKEAVDTEKVDKEAADSEKVMAKQVKKKSKGKR